jgi:DNA mismatch repair protein MutS2
MTNEKELTCFIKENKLSPFNSHKTIIKNKNEGIYKTNDGRSVHTRVIAKISNNFIFPDSSNLLNCFYFSLDKELIIKRQEFFRTIKKELKNEILKSLKKPKQTWSAKYGILVVTDNEKTYTELKNIDVPVKFLLNENDVMDLENYDIVQVIDVDNYGIMLEQLPQSVFLDSIDEVYLERFLEMLSGWTTNIKILESMNNPEINIILEEINPLFNLLLKENSIKITREAIDDKLEKINNNISLKIKDMNISGETMFKMLSENKLPEEIEKIIDDSIKISGLPTQLFVLGIPVRIDEKELDELIKSEEANENTSFAERLKKHSKVLKQIPEKIKKIEEIILIHDFMAGISKFIKDSSYYPIFDNELKIERSKNLFLENPQEISFNLNENYRCSILTGANSGGKTTLIEHIIQLITLSNIGLPLNGKVITPIFSDVYYFAKNKGSASKGAFETLLSQMSKVKPGKQTLILADEIEAVTEPGVAGKIISATSKYFIEKNCFLVIATHLGHEIKKVMPNNARIDGIEAKGLSEQNELIVDHNPILGRLANSTPELIVEKMANSNIHEYFNYLNNYLKENIG